MGGDEICGKGNPFKGRKGGERHSNIIREGKDKIKEAGKWDRKGERSD